MAAELDAIFVDGTQRREREDLESARIGEDGSILHEFVESAHLANELVAGPQVQMIGVREDHLRVHRAKVVGIESLHGGKRADFPLRTPRRLHDAVRCREFTEARRPLCSER